MIDELIESAKFAGLLFVLPLTLFALVAKVADVAAGRRFRRNLVPHVTEHDFDDWRVPVAPYFSESFIRSTRRRFAIAATCGADPENSEGRTAATADPRTTHGGQKSHESFRGQ